MNISHLPCLSLSISSPSFESNSKRKKERKKFLGLNAFFSVFFFLFCFLLPLGQTSNICIGRWTRCWRTTLLLAATPDVGIYLPQVKWKYLREMPKSLYLSLSLSICLSVLSARSISTLDDVFFAIFSSLAVTNMTSHKTLCFVHCNSASISVFSNTQERSQVAEKTLWVLGHCLRRRGRARRRGIYSRNQESTSKMVIMWLWEDTARTQMAKESVLVKSQAPFFLANSKRRMKT